MQIGFLLNSTIFIVFLCCSRCIALLFEYVYLSEHNKEEHENVNCLQNTKNCWSLAYDVNHMKGNFLTRFRQKVLDHFCILIKNIHGKVIGYRLKSENKVAFCSDILLIICIMSSCEKISLYYMNMSLKYCTSHI